MINENVNYVVDDVVSFIYVYCILCIGNTSDEQRGRRGKVKCFCARNDNKFI